MPAFLGKLEAVTGPGGCAVGNKISYADVVLYVTLTQTFKDEAKAKAAYAECPNITAVVESVGNQPGMKKWLDDRPESLF